MTAAGLDPDGRLTSERGHSGEALSWAGSAGS